MGWYCAPFFVYCSVFYRKLQYEEKILFGYNRPENSYEPGSYCIDFTLTFAFSKPQPDACQCLDQFHYRRVGACWRPSLAVVWRKDPGHYLTNSSRHTVASPSTSLTFTQFSEACFHLEMGKSAKFYKRSVSLYKPFSSIFSSHQCCIFQPFLQPVNLSPLPFVLPLRFRRRC